jgi:hypothetical protein
MKPDCQIRLEPNLPIGSEGEILGRRTGSEESGRLTRLFLMSAGWIFLLLIGVGLAIYVPDAEAAQSLHHQFTGQLSRKMGQETETPQTQNYYFRVELAAKSWRITVSTNLGALSNPRIAHLCSAYDGKYLYRLSSLGVSETTSNPSSTQAVHKVTESAVVDEQEAPFSDTEIRTLWFAFASPSYLISRTNFARPIWPVLAPLEKSEFNYERAETEYLDASKTFLKHAQFISDGTFPSYDFARQTANRAAFPPPFNQPWVRASYEVEETGALGELIYPVKFQLRLYNPKQTAQTVEDVFAVYDYRGEVTQAEPLPEEATKAGLLPEIVYQCMVIDYRLPKVGGVPVQYLAANWRDPRDPEIQGIQNAWSQQAAVKRKIGFAFQIVLFCLLTLPPLALWYLKRDRTRVAHPLK